MTTSSDHPSHCADLAPGTLRDIDDPAAFWASLTPAQVLALLREAPKVAGPWVREWGSDTEDAEGWRRRGPTGTELADVQAERWRTLRTTPQAGNVHWRASAVREEYVPDTPGIGTMHRTPRGWCATLDEAKAAADAALIAAGWVLV